jgi:uncharacterized membrane protein YqjE
MRPGLFSSLKGTAATLVAIFRTRLELLASELEEEKLRLLSLLLFALGALFFLALGLVVLVVLCATLFWESRVAVFAIFTAFFLGGAGLLAVLCVRQIKRGSGLFSASIAELGADLAQLRTPTAPSPDQGER